MNSPPAMVVTEPRSKYSPWNIMKRLAHINRPELRWIIAAMITVALLGKYLDREVRDTIQIQTLPPSNGRVGSSGIAEKILTFCWAGAEMRKPQTDQQTDRHGKF